MPLPGQRQFLYRATAGSGRVCPGCSTLGNTRQLCLCRTGARARSFSYAVGARGNRDQHSLSNSHPPAASRAHYGYVRGMLPVTEAVTARIVSLPMYAELTTEQMQMVVKAVKRSTALEVLNS